MSSSLAAEMGNLKGASATLDNAKELEVPIGADAMAKFVELQRDLMAERGRGSFFSLRRILGKPKTEEE